MSDPSDSTDPATDADDQRFETRAIRAGQAPDPETVR